jgi:hypothetical protein
VTKVNNENPLVTIADIPANIQNGHIPNTSQKISPSAKIYQFKYSGKNGLLDNIHSTKIFIPAGATCQVNIIAESSRTERRLG